MQIEIELRPEVEAQLHAEARARGLVLDRLIEAKLNGSISPLPPSLKRSREEFRASLDALTRYSALIPSLPDEAFSRESIYDDHD